MNDGPRKAGIALAIAAIVLGGIFLLTSKDDPGLASCALSAGALAALTKAAHSEESASVIVASVALPVACTEFVKHVADEPDKEVKAEVELPTGEVATYEQSGEELIEPPAQPDPALPDFGRLLECVRWESEVLSQLCNEGVLEPPA